MHCVRLPLNLRPASVALVSSPQKDRVIVSRRGKGINDWQCAARVLARDVPTHLVFDAQSHAPGACGIPRPSALWGHRERRDLLRGAECLPHLSELLFHVALRPKNTMISNKVPLDRRRGICDHSVPHWVNTQGVALECREQ